MKKNSKLLYGILMCVLGCLLLVSCKQGGGTASKQSEKITGVSEKDTGESGITEKKTESSGTSKEKAEKAKETREIILYYLNKTEDGLKEVPYKLKHNNDPIGEVNEVLHRLSDITDNDTDQYKAPISNGVIIRSASLKKNTVSVDFENNYQQLSADKEILLRASLVKSLIQIEGVDSVAFMVGGNGLTGTDDKAIGTMTDDNFILKRNDLYTQKENVILYYANEKGNRLVEVEREVEVTDNMPMEQGILIELIKKSGPSGTKNPLPADLTINSTQVYNNICYVDLSEEIEDFMPDVDDRIKIYSMVNSIVDRGNVSQVQFTVEGEPLEEFNDITGFDEPMSCDYSLAGKKKNKKDDEEVSE